MAVNNVVNIKIKAVENLSEKLGGIKSMAKSVNTSLQSMVGVAKNVTVALGTALAGVGAFGVKSAISLEQTRVAFENLYGDAGKARDMMKSLSDFAKKTPFEFPELTDVALKLKNVAGVGDKQLIPMLTNLGDIASSQGKGISQIVEAYNDAITGEYERLKEFGIKASKSGDNVTFSFKGQQKTVKATSEEIGKYLQEVGKMGGIAGSMDKQSSTLGGRLSTLKDQFKSLSMALIGVSETGDIQAGGMFDKISKAIGTIGTFLEQNQGKIIEVINGIVGAFTFAFDTIYNVMNNLFTGGTGDWIGFFENVKSIVQAGFGVLVTFWKNNGTQIKESVQSTISFIQQYWTEYGSEITLVLETIRNAFVIAFMAIKLVVTSVMNIIGPIIKDAMIIIGESIRFVVKLLTGDFSGAWVSIKKIISSVLDIAGNVIMEFLNLIAKAFGTDIVTVIDGLITKFSDLAKQAKEWGGNMIQMFMDGMKEKVQALKDGIAEISTTISDYLGFHSPTKKGAGKDADKWMPNLINMLAYGLGEGNLKIEEKAKTIAKTLTSIGAKFKINDISNTLTKVADMAKNAFSDVTSNIQTSIDKIKTLKGELEEINKTISDLGGQKKGATQEGKMAIATRAIGIEKQIADIKASGESATSAESLAKIKSLQEELTFANSLTTQQEKSYALQLANRTETQIILATMQEKVMAIDNEIYRQQEQATQKQKQIKDEEVVYKKLVQTKIALDNQYFTLFNQHIEGMKTQITETIKLLQQMSALSGGNTIAIKGAKAVGGPVTAGSTYRVNENGKEYFTPSKSGYITPAGKGGGITFTMGNVNVYNEADENRLIEKMKRMLTQEAKNYNLGIS